MDWDWSKSLLPIEGAERWRSGLGRSATGGEEGQNTKEGKLGEEKRMKKTHFTTNVTFDLPLDDSVNRKVDLEIGKRKERSAREERRVETEGSKSLLTIP